MEQGEKEQSTEYFASEHMTLQFIPIKEVKTAVHSNKSLQPLYWGSGPVYICVTSLLATVDF